MRDLDELPFPMPLAEALAGRSSVRNFKPDVPTRGQVRSLLTAAVQAPTARHQEAWSFIVVQSRDLLRRISDRAKPLIAEHARTLAAADGVTDRETALDRLLGYYLHTSRIASQGNSILASAGNTPTIVAVPRTARLSIA